MPSTQTVLVGRWVESWTRRCWAMPAGPGAPLGAVMGGTRGFIKPGCWEGINQSPA